MLFCCHCMQHGKLRVCMRVLHKLGKQESKQADGQTTLRHAPSAWSSLQASTSGETNEEVFGNVFAKMSSTCFYIVKLSRKCCDLRLASLSFTASLRSPFSV